MPSHAITTATTAPYFSVPGVTFRPFNQAAENHTEGGGRHVVSLRDVERADLVSSLLE